MHYGRHLFISELDTARLKSGICSLGWMIQISTESPLKRNFVKAGTLHIVRMCDLPLLSVCCFLAALARPAVSPTTELMLDLAPGSEDIALLSLSRVDTRDTESEGADNKSLAEIMDILGGTSEDAGSELKQNSSEADFLS